MRSSSTNVKVVAKRKGTFLNKRKLVQTKSSDSNEKVTSKTMKRVREVSRSYLDLNMLLEEVEEEIDFENETLVQNYETWLNDILHQIDGKMVLKQFDFHLPVEQVIECIDKNIWIRICARN